MEKSPRNKLLSVYVLIAILVVAGVGLYAYTRSQDYGQNADNPILSMGSAPEDDSAPADVLSIDETVTLSGTVTEVFDDIDSGEAGYELDGTYRVVTDIVQPEQTESPQPALGYVEPEIVVGDSVEVYGMAKGDYRLELLGSEDYYIKKVDL